MRLHRVDIKNFRLLKKVSLCFDRQSTVVVGRNNSGKTSLTELFRRWLQDEKSKFRLEDFSLSAYDMFWDAYRLHVNGAETEKVRTALPAIETRLTIAYGDSTELGVLGEFIVDLDLDTTEAVALLRYEPKETAVAGLFDGISPNPKGSDVLPEGFFKELADRIPANYEAVLLAVDPKDETNTKALEWAKLRSLLQVGFINAQRGLDDVTHRDRDVLGRVLESLFRTAASGERSSDLVTTDRMRSAEM